MNHITTRCEILLVCVAILCATGRAQDRDRENSNFARKNLVAWCIVPFDAKHRGPSERAEMVKRLGLSRVAYDWRAEHVPTFEEEILQYKQHGIEYFAFWTWHEDMEPLIRKHKIKPQIWQTCRAAKQGSQQERIEAAAKSVLPLVEKTRDLGLRFGLYNHGGWGGEPANLVAVCKHLRKHHDAEHVGIVYNFHHGHGHIDGFADSLQLMQPYLLCLNLNGMAEPSTVDPKTNRNKIIPVGSGTYEQQMIQAIIASGYTGPLGVLGHRAEIDAEEALRLNLDGLAKILDKLNHPAATQKGL